MSRVNKPDIFSRFTRYVATALGREWVFLGALLIIGVWAITGPIFHFSNTWQLIINTGTTIVTFLMVFIIQNTQNRDTTAMNIKLDAIMEKLKIDDEELIEAEDSSEKDLESIKQQLQDADSPRKQP